MATLLKIFGIAVKQIAKPVSKMIVESAVATAEHSPDAFLPVLTKNVGRAKHWATLRIQANYAGVSNAKIKELEGNQAIKEGAEFVGEAFIFSVAAGFVLLFEVHKQHESDLKSQKAKAQKSAETAAISQRFSSIEEQVQDLQRKNSILEHKIKDLEQVSNTLATGVAGVTADEPKTSNSTWSSYFRF